MLPIFCPLSPKLIIYINWISGIYLDIHWIIGVYLDIVRLKLGTQDKSRYPYLNIQMLRYPADICMVLSPVTLLCCQRKLESRFIGFTLNFLDKYS